MITKREKGNVFMNSPLILLIFFGVTMKKRKFELGEVSRLWSILFFVKLNWENQILKEEK